MSEINRRAKIAELMQKLTAFLREQQMPEDKVSEFLDFLGLDRSEEGWVSLLEYFAKEHLPAEREYLPAEFLALIKQQLVFK